MTDHGSAAPAGVPAACTLPTAEQPVRLAEFDALFATAVRDGERLAPGRLRVTLAGGARLADSVRDLAERETRCCSFFTFTVTTPADGVVRLDIAVPAGQVAVLDSLQDRVTHGRAR
jgi:hypothetical protein